MRFVILLFRLLLENLPAKYIGLKNIYYLRASIFFSLNALKIVLELES